MSFLLQILKFNCEHTNQKNPSRLQKKNGLLMNNTNNTMNDRGGGFGGHNTTSNALGSGQCVTLGVFDTR